MQMTQDQFMGLTRQGIQIAGTVLTTLGFGSIAASLTNKTTIIMAAAGPVFQLGALAWNVHANSKSSIIASATSMPEVDSKKLVAAIADPDLKEVAKQGTGT